jgi:hypothetical protein
MEPIKIELQVSLNLSDETMKFFERIVTGIAATAAIAHRCTTTIMQATEPAKSAAEPAKSAAEPAKSAAKPAKSAAEPAKSAAKPAAEPVAEPAKPAKPAAKPAAEPVAEPVAEPAAEPVAEPAKPAAEPAKPAAETKEYSIDDVRKLLVTKINSHRPEIKDKLSELGAPSVTKLEQSKYPDFVSFLNSLS